VNDYKQMQQLYEEGVGQEPFPYSNVGGKLRGLRTSNRGNLKYRQAPPGSQISIDRTPPQLTYKNGIPTVHPGKQGDNYSSPGSQNYSVPTASIVSDEEVEERKISNTAVIGKIEELITTAEEEDNPACTYALAQLMKHVKDLPEVK